jgi:hypothetical protein
MGTDKTDKIVQNIHSSESWLKMCSDKVIYPLAFVVVFVTFISPYSVRIFWAFFLNIFFNAPKTYLTIISKAIGQTMNGIVLRICYFTLFGIYAVLYKSINLIIWKRSMSKSTWVKPTSKKRPASDLLRHPF